MKLLTIIGARPQFVKAAMVSRALKEFESCSEIIVHTGQHYDANMSGVFFEQLDIPSPQYHLGIGSGPHGQQTGRMLEAIEEVLLRERPQCVLVYGDTNSTLAGALAAAKLHIPVAHVEAGLRSLNMRMPEEVNRALTDRISTLLFAPTAAAVEHLRREGFEPPRIHLVGDVMYDAAILYSSAPLVGQDPVKRLNLTLKDFVLATIHRAETTDDPKRLASVFQGLAHIAADMRVVVPLHPRTHKILESAGLLQELKSSVTFIEPLGYIEMTRLEQAAKVIITDSGGVQKEAFFHGVPCVTVREETEWVELVEIGWNRLADPRDSAAIVRAYSAAITTPLPQRPSLYGGGRASRRIAEILVEFRGASP